MKADRVAVLSDVHGVLPALEAVLAEPAVRAADLIVVTGDHVAGPLPTLTLELFSSLENLVLVRGNADRELVAPPSGPTISYARRAPIWTRYGSSVPATGEASIYDLRHTTIDLRPFHTLQGVSP